MSFCEKCFDEMPRGDGAWSTLCHRCDSEDPGSGEIRTLYGRPPFGVWDHLRNNEDAEIPVRTTQHTGPHIRLPNVSGPAKCEDNL